MALHDEAKKEREERKRKKEGKRGQILIPSPLPTRTHSTHSYTYTYKYIYIYVYHRRTTCIESPMIYLDERTPFRRRKGTAPEIDFDRVGNGTLAHGVSFVDILMVFSG